MSIEQKKIKSWVRQGSVLGWRGNTRSSWRGCFRVALSPWTLVRNALSFVGVEWVKSYWMQMAGERSHFVKTSLTVWLLGLTRVLELGQNSESSQVSPVSASFFSHGCLWDGGIWNMMDTVDLLFLGHFQEIWAKAFIGSLIHLLAFNSVVLPMFFSNRMLPVGPNVEGQIHKTKAAKLVFVFNKCEASCYVIGVTWLWKQRALE